MKFEDLTIGAVFYIPTPGPDPLLRVKVSENNYCNRGGRAAFSLVADTEVKEVSILRTVIPWKALKPGDICRSGIPGFQGFWAIDRVDGMLSAVPVQGTMSSPPTEVIYYDFESAKILEADMPYNELDQEFLKSNAEIARITSRGRNLSLQVIRKLNRRNTLQRVELEQVKKERSELIGHALDQEDRIESVRELLSEERELRKKRERQLRNLLRKKGSPRKKPKPSKKTQQKINNIFLADYDLDNYDLRLHHLPFRVEFDNEYGGVNHDQRTAARAISSVMVHLGLEHDEAVERLRGLLKMEESAQKDSDRKSSLRYIALPAVHGLSLPGRIFVNVRD